MGGGHGFALDALECVRHQSCNWFAQVVATGNMIFVCDFRQAVAQSWEGILILVCVVAWNRVEPVVCWHWLISKSWKMGEVPRCTDRHGASTVDRAQFEIHHSQVGACNHRLCSVAVPSHTSNRKKHRVQMNSRPPTLNSSVSHGSNAVNRPSRSQRTFVVLRQSSTSSSGPSKRKFDAPSSSVAATDTP